ncbi:MAG: hypothetical protein V7735_24800 [Photobacterium frigidiphilum]|uniref:hypothetical protein n=1 Tax=Photobacterium frigidiphilum TaxID=264736 RepID=UPI003003905A
MKKKLVCTIERDVGNAKRLPQQYIIAKQYWQCEVSIEDEDGVINEYDIVPDQKLYLSAFLELAEAKINEFDESGISIWNAKLYRVLKK